MKYIKIIPVYLIILFNHFSGAHAQSISHDIFDGLLKKYVNAQGNVDYSGMKKDQQTLNKYLDLVSKHEPNLTWSQEEQLAYWINAYNAFTISLVLKHYPVASIKDIKRGISFINSVWDIKFIKIGKETYDLNNIEHGILRKKFNEPRIHFAINCASYSCPRLINEAYTASKLDAQLSAAARGFLSDKTKNNIQQNHLMISKIFDWFSGDFKKKGSLIDFLNQYAPVKINSTAKIDFYEYNWALNKQ